MSTADLQNKVKSEGLEEAEETLPTYISTWFCSSQWNHSMGAQISLIT